jgi:transposase-like protein
MLPWESANLFQIYGNDFEMRCTCGSTKFKKAGFYYTGTNKYQKYKCKECGSEYRDRESSLSKDERKSLERTTKR